MKRLRLDLLSSEEGLLMYEGGPFTGVAYEVKEYQDAQALYVERGILVGVYYSDFLEDSENDLHVDITEAYCPDELLYHKGSPYSGIGYEFSDGVCDRETRFVNGFTEAEAIFDLAGNLIYCQRSYRGVHEKYEWFANGQMKKMRFGVLNGSVAYLTFSENGFLTHIGGNWSFFSAIRLMSEKSKYFPFKDISHFSSLRCAEKLLLHGSAIDDEFIDVMLKEGMLINTKRIEVHDISVSGLTVLQLKGTSEIEK